MKLDFEEVKQGERMQSRDYTITIVAIPVYEYRNGRLAGAASLTPSAGGTHTPNIGSAHHTQLVSRSRDIFFVPTMSETVPNNIFKYVPWMGKVTNPVNRVAQRQVLSRQRNLLQVFVVTTIT
jgi:hypothetical protein